MTTNLVVAHPDIPRRAVSLTHTHTWGDTNGLQGFNNTRSGKRYNIAQLQSATSDPVKVNYNLGSGNGRAADHLIIGRADLLKNNGCSRIVLRGSSQSSFVPLSISGLKLWLDANREVTYDANRKVSQWNDLSGNANHATQATSGNRPILTRADNRENLYLYSEEFDNGSHSKNALTITADATANPLTGAINADKLCETATTAEHYTTNNGAAANILNTQSVTLGVYVKAAERGFAVVQRAGTAFTGTRLASIDLSTGAISGITGTAPTVASAGNGWYLVTFTETATANGTAYLNVFCATASATTNYLGVAGSGIYAWGLFCRTAAADSTYITTTSYPQYRGINGNRAIAFDGTDDYLSANSIATLLSGEDKAMTIVMACTFRKTDSAAEQMWATGSSVAGNPSFRLRKENRQLQYAMVDNAATTVTLTSGGSQLTAGDSAIVTHSTSGTSGQGWYNGTSWGSGAANVGVITVDRFTIGAIGKASYSTYASLYVHEVLVFNTALSTNDRQAVEAYLTSKWITAPVVHISDLSTQALTDDTDLVVEFATTSSYQHWWLEFDGVSTKLPVSKIYFGKWLDLTDPQDLKPGWTGVSRDRFQSGAGAKFLGIADRSLFKLDIEWTQVSDSDLADFFSNIVGPAALNEGAFLYARTNRQVLDGSPLRHARLVTASNTAHEKLDYNRLTASYVELPDR